MPDTNSLGKCRGTVRWRGFWARTGPMWERHDNHAAAVDSGCGCHPVERTTARNRAGTVCGQPLSQSWITAWYPPPLKLCIKSYHLRKSISLIRYRTNHLNFTYFFCCCPHKGLTVLSSKQYRALV